MSAKTRLFVAMFLACGACGQSRTPETGSLTPEQIAYQQQLANEQSAREEQVRIAQQNTAAINRVLAADVSQGALGGGSAAIADRMAQIDLTGVPGDFRSAYVDHIEAWRQVGRIDTALTRLKSDEQMGDAVIGGLLTTIFGSSATPFSDHIQAIAELDRRRPEFSEAVSATYATVKSVAARYSAAPPPIGTPASNAM